MTDKLEDLLVAEFRDGSYELPVDAGRLATALRRRRARRTTVTAAASVAGVALAATAGVGAMNLVGPGTAPGPSAGSAVATTASSGAPATAVARWVAPGTLRLGDADVRGLPAGSTVAAAGDPAVVEPRVESPATGDGVVLTVPSTSGARIRLAVVVDAQGRAGLPGVPATDQDWLGSLGGSPALLTVDGPTDTTYFSATTPTGRRWHLAATGSDAVARLALVRTVALATVPGS